MISPLTFTLLMFYMNTSNADQSCDEGVNLEVFIRTDFRSSETAWSLTDDTTGDILFSNPNDIDSSTNYQQSSCGTAGHCFTFSITDDYGDGICCYCGDGYYKFYADGVLQKQGGNFGAIDEVTFCNTPTMSPTPCSGVSIDLELKTDSYPGDTDYILLDITNGETLIEPITYLEANTLYEQNACGPSGHCFKFAITDWTCDGICCGYGNGYYYVYADGALITIGGIFDGDDSHEWCDDGCEDSRVPIAYGQREISCAQIVSGGKCDEEGAKSHCPDSCNACSEFGCADSQAPLNIFERNRKTCADFQNFATDEEIEEICGSNIELATTCRGTCKICEN